jgi:hypothetical protein
VALAIRNFWPATTKPNISPRHVRP